MGACILSCSSPRAAGLPGENLGLCKFKTWNDISVHQCFRYHKSIRFRCNYMVFLHNDFSFKFFQRSNKK